MSLKNVDIMSAMQRVAERRIEEAMREGKFDNLQGKGEPLDLEPLPADENVRAQYWALRILKQNDVIPDEVRYRKLIDRLKSDLFGTRSESRLRTLVRQINALVHKLNTLGTNALPGDVNRVDEEAEVRRLRAGERT